MSWKCLFNYNIEFHCCIYNSIQMISLPFVDRPVLAWNLPRFTVQLLEYIYSMVS